MIKERGYYRKRGLFLRDLDMFHRSIRTTDRHEDIARDFDIERSTVTKRICKLKDRIRNYVDSGNDLNVVAMEFGLTMDELQNVIKPKTYTNKEEELLMLGKQRREMDVDAFRRYYFQEETQRSIGEDYGYTPSTISQHIKYLCHEIFMKCLDCERRHENFDSVKAEYGMTDEEVRTAVAMSQYYRKKV